MIIKRIQYSTDSHGNVCGYGVKVDKKSLNLIISTHFMSYECFEECNSRIIIYDNIKYVEGIPIDFRELKYYDSCIKSGKCFLRLPSRSKLNRCVPSINEENMEYLNPYFKKGKVVLDQNELKKLFEVTSFIEQLCFYTWNYRYTYVKCALICIVITYLILIVMVYLPKATIYTIFAITLIAFSVVSVGLWYLYVTSDTSVNGITATIVLVVIILLIIWLRVKINIALKILYETS
eukprot:jgi/Orpsp1_1/1190976/evm.model.d7180000082628.1